MKSRHLPKPKPVERDTMVNVLTHEDSLRIQDSVRHARWLYWQRYKKRKEQQEAAKNAAEGEEVAAPATESTPPATGSHPTHTTHNDSLHKQ